MVDSDLQRSKGDVARKMVIVTMMMLGWRQHHLPSCGGRVVVVDVVVGHGPMHDLPLCSVILSLPYVHFLSLNRNPFTPHFASHGPNFDHAVHGLSENGTRVEMRVAIKRDTYCMYQ